MSDKKTRPVAGTTERAGAESAIGQTAFSLDYFNTVGEARQALKRAAFECRRAAAILELEAHFLGSQNDT